MGLILRENNLSGDLSSLLKPLSRCLDLSLISYLDVSYNTFTSLGPLRELLPNLAILDVERNQLTQLSPQSLPATLQQLSFNHNQISVLSDDLGLISPRLTSIQGGHNCLSTIPRTVL